LVSVIVLLSVAFYVGYRAGDDKQNSLSPNVEATVSVSQAQPTVTPIPTRVLPTLQAVATDIAEPTTAEKAPATTRPQNEEQSPPTPSPTVSHPEHTEAPQVESNSADQVQTSDPALSDDEALQILNEVWNLIEGEFFGELPTPEQRAYSAIRGMLETLDDDYTSFSEPSIAEIRRTDNTGSFEGIGAHVTMNEDDILEIVQTFKDSPAENAGLLSGDLVLAVDGQSIVGFGIYDAITLIRGPEGTTVTLAVQRGDGEPFDVVIVRARLDIPIIESELLDGSIGYVQLYEFSSPATERLESAIDSLFEQGATSLILDLRGNPGGFLEQAVQVSDLFLDEGLVLIERRSDGGEVEFTSTAEGLAQDVPLVVLIDGGSASASEIVAGAIQDRNRGTLVGETSFGKGSVQLLHTLSDGSELRVTVAHWFTPDDRAIHGQGLAPDIEVVFSAEEHESGQDPQLERALEYLTTGQ
jgi:carboxyl-terminal processing protease